MIQLQKPIQMGNCAKAQQDIPYKNNSHPPPNLQSKTLTSNFTCPNCYEYFQKGSSFEKFTQHMKVCVIEADEAPKNAITGKDFSIEKIRRNSQEYIYEKVPDDQEGIRFSWMRVESKSMVQQRKKEKSTASQVKKWPFQQKEAWFRSKLQKLRVDWTLGCSWMKINKENILLSSIQSIKNVSMHKEIKIQFLGQQAYDAGGLLREWIHLLTQQIFSQEINLFARAHTDQMVYKLTADFEVDQQFASEILILFGTVLGKALFEKIPVCSYLDRTIIRQLCGGKVCLSDVHSYDSGLYESWKYILQQTVNQDFQVTFSIAQKSTTGISQIELKDNGKEIQLTEENKNQYIQLCIDYYCTKRVRKLLQFIKKGLYKVIPMDVMSVFEPHQLEMLLYGVPFIDLKDWKQNTVYLGAYYPTHKAILWFWEFMESLSQEKLSKFLQFCTGSGRTPINGFKKLQTNRGNQSKFCIESRFYCERDPYPKGHTCFNRFQYPAYPKKQLALKYLQQILNFQTEGIYGLD